MNRLEELCRPLILLVCDYYNSARAGAAVNPAEMRHEILIAIDDVRRKCENDAPLRRDFDKVEQPIIFFIDYMIKEGNFPFSRSWEPIAHDYQELSGDAKFYDLLAETLDDPTASDTLQIFYLLMGVGFDGCFKKKRENVAHRMQLCAVRCHTGKDLTPEKMRSTSSDRRVPKHFSLHYRSKHVLAILCGCA